MITRIKIEGFKSLESVELHLGRVNLLVGTNASGKSNFFDALRVLQGIAYGFTIAEVLDGKPKSAKSDVWEPIRGGSENARFVGANGRPGEPRIRHGRGEGEPIIRFSVTIQPREANLGTVEYTIGISHEEGSVRQETLSINGACILDSIAVPNSRESPVLAARLYSKGAAPHSDLDFDKYRSVLHQIGWQLGTEHWAEELHDVRDVWVRSLANLQRLDPSPAVLRNYSQARFIDRMGERGDNFAALVHGITRDPETRAAYVSWLRELTPSEVEDVEILHGALQEPLFALKERGKIFPAPILSDGTLRFAAITAAFFQPDMPDLLSIEEVENGIHPSRLRLLVELLKRQSKVSKTQVIATTHSPALLAWLQPEDFRTTFLCQRDGETGASHVRPLSEVPHFLDLIERHSVGEMFAEGWLETVP